MNMLEAPGTVVESGDGVVWVETRTRSACAHCSSSGCASAAVSGLYDGRRNRFRLAGEPALRSGDRVVIGISDALLVRAALLAYLLPAGTLILGALLAGELGAGDGAQALAALAGLAAGFGIARRFARSAPGMPGLLRAAGPAAPGAGKVDLAG